ncbi:hypothetical protein [Salinisphaera shabanensis]|uniref:hypothetical protein n=1 Tax=Salinisphaera shabanensis TaxID=180542 RepID=UPI0033419B49
MSRKKARHEAHVRLYRHEHESPAYQSLSVEARALLVEFRALYNGGENRIHMSAREMKRRLNGIHQRRAARARDELLERGFIRLLAQGTFTRKARHATEYALTNEPLNNNGLAPKDFMRWRPQQNTATTVDTLGNHSGYRKPAESSEKQRDGNHSGYQEGPKHSSHGNHSGYTDKLPTGGGDGWLAKYGGWPCRNKSVLNTCCLVCGVWITSSRYEFDGGKHSCDPVSRAKYEARLQRANDAQAAA